MYEYCNIYLIIFSFETFNFRFHNCVCSKERMNMRAGRSKQASGAPEGVMGHKYTTRTYHQHFLKQLQQTWCDQGDSEVVALHIESSATAWTLYKNI
jgi:hypothetical protein